MNNTSRRGFLRRSAAASAAWLGTSFGHVPWLRAAGANEDVRVGVVGIGSRVKAGGMGRGEVRHFRGIPGVRVVAMCDVDSANLGPEVEAAAKRNEKVAAYADVRRLLEDKDIDAIVVTTPNHWHALVTIWACQAGKDVYVQKPASYNIFEGRQMVAVARKYKRIVQCPNGSRIAERRPRGAGVRRPGQPRQDPRTFAACDSAPGPASAKWPGRSRFRRPWTTISGPVRRRSRRWPARTSTTTGTGTGPTATASWATGASICWTAAARRPGAACRDTPSASPAASDTTTTARRPTRTIVYYDYQPAPVLFELRGLPKDKSFMANPRPDSWGKNAMDTYLGISIGKVIHCENGYVVGSTRSHTAFDSDGKRIQDFKPTTPELGHNFIEAVRTRRAEDLAADILDGHLSAVLVHLGNISHRIGRTMSDSDVCERIAGNQELAAAYDRMKAHLSSNGVDLEQTPATLGAMLTFDSDSERFVGEFAEQANQLVSRKYRSPFIVPQEV